MRKPALCICETKAADQLLVTEHLISAYAFASTQIAQSLYFINFKPVIAQPGLCRTWSETPSIWES